MTTDLSTPARSDAPAERVTPGHRSLREPQGNARRRRVEDRLVTVSLHVALVLAVLALALIVHQVVLRGFGALSWSFLTQIEPVLLP